MRFHEAYRGWQQRRLTQEEAARLLGVHERTFRRYINSMFFVAEEGTASSFRGVRETLEARGLFCSLYTDRGSHYWHTPVAGGKVDKANPTQFGRAMAQLGIELIPAYSPEARGRSERAFATHQHRLVRELAREGITTLVQANRYLQPGIQRGVHPPGP